MSRKLLFYTLQLAAIFLTIAHAIPSLEKRDEFSGQATFYTPGLGACGGTSSSSSMIAALNKPQFGGGNPNSNPACGKTAIITGPKGSCTVTIVDLCPECAYGSLDLSPAAFNQIADPSAGRVHIDWHFAGEGAPVAAAVVTSSTPTPTPTPTPTSTTTTTTSSSSTSTSTSTSTTTTSTSTDAASPTKVPSVFAQFWDGDVPFLSGTTLNDGTNPLSSFVQGN